MKPAGSSRFRLLFWIVALRHPAQDLMKGIRGEPTFLADNLTTSDRNNPRDHDITLTEKVQTPTYKIIDRERKAGSISWRFTADRADLDHTVIRCVDNDDRPGLGARPVVKRHGCQKNVPLQILAHTEYVRHRKS